MNPELISPHAPLTLGSCSTEGLSGRVPGLCSSLDKFLCLRSWNLLPITKRKTSKQERHPSCVHHISLNPILLSLPVNNLQNYVKIKPHHNKNDFLGSWQSKFPSKKNRSLRNNSIFKIADHLHQPVLPD